MTSSVNPIVYYIYRRRSSLWPIACFLSYVKRQSRKKLVEGSVEINVRVDNVAVPWGISDGWFINVRRQF